MKIILEQNLLCNDMWTILSNQQKQNIWAKDMMMAGRLWTGKNKNKIKRTKCLEYYENIFEYKEKYTAKYL